MTKVVIDDLKGAMRHDHTGEYDTRYLKLIGGALSGNLGIGENTPTAYLHIGAGTATNPPIKLTSGTNLTTPEAGALEFSSKALHFTPASDLRTIDLTDGIVTSTTTVVDTVTETTIYTESVSANEFHAGQTVHLRILGRYSTANATDTVTLRLKVGSTTIKTFATVAKNVTDTPLDIEFIFTIRSEGASGTVWTYAKAELDNIATGSADTSTTTINTTIAEDITVTAQWSSANAGNSLSVDQGFTHFYN